jgi:hypothetical protein
VFGDQPLGGVEQLFSRSSATVHVEKSKCMLGRFKHSCLNYSWVPRSPERKGCAT